MATATVTLGLNSNPLVQGLARARGKVQAFGAATTGTFRNFGRGAIGPLTTALSGAAFVGAINNSVKMGARLHNLSKQTGIAVGELYELSGAFEENDKTTDDAAVAIGRMQKAIGGGAKNFKNLTVSVADLERLRPSQQFQAIGRSIMQIKDPTERVNAAMDVFGKSGASLIPVFEQVADMDFSKLSSGAQFIQKNAKAFDDLDDSITRAKRSRDLFFAGLASKAAGPLMGISEKATPEETLAAGQKLGETIGKLPNDPGKMLEQDKKDINKALTFIGSIAKAILPSKMASALQQQGQLWMNSSGLAAAGKAETAAPAAATGPRDPWGKLSSFTSFKAPQTEGNAESIRNSNAFGNFFGMGGAPGERGPMGQLMNARGTSMTGAYGTSDIRGPKWKERAEKADKPATKEDIDQVMGKYWN